LPPPNLPEPSTAPPVGASGHPIPSSLAITLVRLKKARQALQDAKAAAHSSLEDALAPRPWLEAAEQEIIALLNNVEALITEVRDSLA